MLRLDSEHPKENIVYTLPRVPRSGRVYSALNMPHKSYYILLRQIIKARHDKSSVHPARPRRRRTQEMSEERLRRVVAQPAGRSLWANDLAVFFAGPSAEVAR